MWFILAALILIAVAGVLLWLSRAPQATPQTAPQTAPQATQQAQVEAPSSEEPDQPASPLVEDVDIVEPAYEVVEELEPLAEVEPEPEPEVVEPVAVQELLQPELEAEPAQEPAQVLEPELEQELEPEPELEPALQPEHKLGLKLPGTGRRERKHWAADNGFSFAKSDAYLTDEWSRGAAATGAAPREVVSGVVSCLGVEYEMYLVDLEHVPVMAIRRGAASDVVVDARRVGILLDDDSDDLLRVTQTNGFHVLSNDLGAAERVVDERVIAALGAMPEVVTAVWAESDWVLAQTEKNSTSEDWDRMIQPLAMMADACRVLPPRAVRNLDIVTKTRPVGEEPVVVKQEDAGVVRVPRAEEPVTLPSRAQHTALGVVEARPVGADEVGAIADGPAELPESDGTKVVRRDGESTIF